MTTKEMLEFYDGLIEDAISSGGDYGEFPMDPDSEKQFRLAAEPIRIAIIERGPEVSRAFVERWAKKIDRDYGDFTTRADPTRDNLKAMLREAGVTVIK